jgi:NitT/TauT family transport system permease protein
MQRAAVVPENEIVHAPFVAIHELGTGRVTKQEIADFILVHAVLWAVALNSYVGFQGVSPTQRMVGQNYGLRGVMFAVKILIPAALATVLSGMKIGWAFAWRTLIGAELVFGATTRGGGLGWHIFENSELLRTKQVFAGLFMIILIGVVVEYVIFRTLELRTVRRWGMQR